MNARPGKEFGVAHREAMGVAIPERVVKGVVVAWKGC